MAYSESIEAQNALMEARFNKVQNYLSRLADEAESSRTSKWSVPEGISTGEYTDIIRPYRAEVENMISYPPPGTPIAVAEPETIEIGSDEDGIFYRVNIPLMKEGLAAYGLLIKPHTVNPSKTLAVAIHGGGGTPEHAVGILGENNYNDMGRRLARRGHVVWMPSNYERSSYEDTSRDAHRAIEMRAKLVGTTLSAIDAYNIIRSTETMLSYFDIQNARAIAVGLSYGGFRALEVSALSDIFKACISSCYFNNRRSILEGQDASFMDWYFPNVLAVATDVELCQLICPRPLFIEVGLNDDLFLAKGAIETSRQVEALYTRLGIADLYEFDAFEGMHEFSGIKAFEFLDKLGL